MCIRSDSILLVCLLALLGCSEAIDTTATEDVPKEISTGVQITSAGAKDFVSAGCIAVGDKISCVKLGLEDTFHCTSITKVQDELAGLEPAYPIARCVLACSANKDWCSEMAKKNSGYIYSFGGLAPAFYRYVIIKDDQFQLISTKKELADIFGSVDSPGEALAFATAVSSASPIYKIEVPEGYNKLVDAIETTTVQEITNGYEVNLFAWDSFGCGDHNYEAHYYTVAKTGEVDLSRTVPIYDNPADNGICVD